MGASMRKYITFLKRNSSCSNRKAAQVPRRVERMVTLKATFRETKMLRRFFWSWKNPIFCGPSLKNQSRVKPFQGREGNMESLKAKTQVTRIGANRKKK
jgi:hypothetical protein